MQRVIEPIALGGTLFVPANHKILCDILGQKRFCNLRSIVIDTEDGLHVNEVNNAIENITVLLQDYKKNSLYVFIRPRNADFLEKLLHVKNIESIDGFILPKFSLDSMSRYLELLKPYSFYLMPSIEGDELFHPEKMRLLKDEIDTVKEKVLLIRFGAEDMLSQLGLRRSNDLSLYDMKAPSLAISNLLHIFKVSGYTISGPVYPFYKDDKGFTAELTRDLQEGLITKTIIHPSQIDLVEKHYRVEEDDLRIAKKILGTSQKSVFGDKGMMSEVPTQSSWAKSILSRHHYYGPTDTSHLCCLIEDSNQAILL